MSLQVNESTIEKGKAVIELLSLGLAVARMMRKNNLTVEDIAQLFEMDEPEKFLEEVRR